MIMGNKIREIFNPTPEELERQRIVFRNIFEKLSEEKGCSTCSHCKHVQDYPGFVTAEECECDAGLQCDTVLFSVKDCRKYEKAVW